MPFVAIELSTDPDELTDDQVAFIQATFPDWVRSDGNLDYIILQGNAQEASIQRFQLTEISEAALRAFGTLAGVPPRDPARATGTVTVVISDTDGHELPADTEIAIPGLDGSPVAFRFVDDTTIDALESGSGSGDETTQTIPGLVIEAIDEGVEGSGLSGPADLLSSLAFIESITVEGVTSGGTDGETDSEYLDRLSERLRLQADRLILPEDFALYFHTQITGCFRAVALDTYDPIAETYDNEGYVTVVGVDEDGEALSTPIKNEAQAAMLEHSVGGQIVYVVDPEYTAIDVEVEVVALPDYDVDDLQSRVEAALEEYLSPGNWNKHPTSGDDASWINDRYVRYLEVAEKINSVDGVHYILDGTLLVESLADTDILLSGEVPLTRAGTITVTAQLAGYEPASGS